MTRAEATEDSPFVLPPGTRVIRENIRPAWKVQGMTGWVPASEVKKIGSVEIGNIKQNMKQQKLSKERN